VPSWCPSGARVTWRTRHCITLVGLLPELGVGSPPGFLGVWSILGIGSGSERCRGPGAAVGKIYPAPREAAP
jgi:hypothetical protein